jgi:hypothetical protein
MSWTLGTAQQLAAQIVEGGNALPGTKFLIDVMQHAQNAPYCQLATVFGDDGRTLCSTRDVAQARRFATIDAAVREAQRIARTAGYEGDHRWTGSADSLPCMPTIEIRVISWAIPGPHPSRKHRPQRPARHVA